MSRSAIRKRRRQRERRGRIYLLGALVLVIIVAVGLYAYASSQQGDRIVYATLNTSHGPIQVELYQSKTPKTVDNFVNLAKSGFYDNLVWHRVVKGFVIQTGEGGSSQTVPLEIDASLHNYAGYLGMARIGDDLNSGTSQFYINLVDNLQLDGQYTVFGKVTSGMNVALAIANVPVDSQSRPIDPVLLTSVTVSSSQ